jgi:hypothetical protein
LAFKIIIILHNTLLATFIKLLETVSKGLFRIDSPNVLDTPHICDISRLRVKSFFISHMIGPTDLPHPSPAAHLKTFQVLLMRLCGKIMWNRTGHN